MVGYCGWVLALSAFHMLCRKCGSLENVCSKVEKALLGILWVVPFGDDVITLTLFLVRPELRKRGLGSELMRTAKLRVGDRNISVSAVSNMIPMYEKYGPRSTGVVHTIFNGVRLSDVTPVANDVGEKIIVVRNRDVSGVKKSVMEYDRTVFPIGRDSFVERFVFGHPAAHIKAAFIGDRIVGYGYLREANDHVRYYMPVLYGDSDEIVNILLAELMRFVPDGGKISVWARNDNAHAMKLLRQIANIELEIPCIEMVMQPLNLGWDKAYFSHFCDCALI